VLTETTAEIAAALTLAAARRVAEADVFMRAGKYEGWLPTLFVGQLLQNKTVGIIGAGRIGAAYARMMVEGHKMDLVYYDPYPNEKLEAYVRDYGKFLESKGERPVSVERKETVEDVLSAADVCCYSQPVAFAHHGILSWRCPRQFSSGGNVGVGISCCCSRCPARRES
jgi:glycerate dehydrogenase